MDLGNLYEAEYKRQYKKIDTYFDQFTNISSGILHFIGRWLFLSIVGVWIIVFLGILLIDLNAYSFLDLQGELRRFFIVSGTFSFLYLLFTNAGNFKNFFEKNAWDYAKRYMKTKSRVESQMETIDSLLLQYGLITKKDIELRKKQLKLNHNKLKKKEK